MRYEFECLVYAYDPTPKSRIFIERKKSIHS